MTKLNALRSELAQLQAAIASKKKASRGADDCRSELVQKTKLDAIIADAHEAARDLETERAAKLSVIGNVVHDAVPCSPSEDGNVVLRSWGEPRQTTALPHWEVLRMLGACEFERGARVAGRRGYFLRGDGVMLNMALQAFGVAFLASRGYVPIQPPYMMRKEVMARTAELDDFDAQLYHVSVGRGKSATHPVPHAGDTADDVDESYLIATSEQPLSAMHQDEVLQPADLPVRYVGVSPCFRTETGSRGLEAKGIFRVHQFEKVEQFVISDPAKSDAEFETMTALVEEFYQTLGVPFRIVSIASGGLNNAANVKRDLEAWFAHGQEFRELVSCSNCTDFQARALNVRQGAGVGSGPAGFVHMLNATLCATERTMACLLENNQEEGGVRVPRALIPYMHGRDFLRYRTPPGQT